MKRKNRNLLTTPIAALLTAVAVAACGTATAATISNTGTTGTGISTAATTAAGPAGGQLKAFVDCMRSHGVSGFGGGPVAAPAPGAGSTVASTGTSTGATTQAATSSSPAPPIQTVTGSGTGTSTTATAQSARPPQRVVVISSSFSSNGRHGGFSLRWNTGGKHVSANVMRAAMQACSHLLPHPPAPTAAQLAAASAKAKAFSSCLAKHGVAKLRAVVATRGAALRSSVTVHVQPLKSARLPAAARAKVLKATRLANVSGAAIQIRRSVKAGHVVALGKLSAHDKQLAKAVQACGGPALGSSSASSAAPSVRVGTSSK
jgi:hypothetical protein